MSASVLFSVPRPSKPAAAPLPLRLQQVVDLVVRERKVSIALILNDSRCRADTARARQLAMYLAHVVFGQSLTAIGEAFGRDRTTVSYACGLIEDLRDDRQFDAEVSRLEALLEQHAGAGNGAGETLHVH